MLLGDRQVRHRQSTSKSAQVARGARLPRRNFATSPASDILANPAGRVGAEGEEMSAQDWTTFVVIFGVAALVMWRLDRLGKQIEAVRDQLLFELGNEDVKSETLRSREWDTNERKRRVSFGCSG
jgi:hypothetical protein